LHENLQGFPGATAKGGKKFSIIQIEAEKNSELQKIVFRQELIKYSSFLLIISSGTMTFLLGNYLDEKEIIGSWLFRISIFLLLASAFFGVLVQSYYYKISLLDYNISVSSKNRLTRLIYHTYRQLSLPILQKQEATKLLYFQQYLLLLSYLLLIIFVFFPCCR